jgi:hypothetical protein
MYRRVKEGKTSEKKKRVRGDVKKKANQDEKTVCGTQPS